VEWSEYTAVSGGEVKGKSRSQGCGGHENEVPGMRQRVQIVRSYGCIGQYGTVQYSTVQYSGS
jgi:hypothetical protein